jgi:hypothetical protein
MNNCPRPKKNKHTNKLKPKKTKTQCQYMKLTRKDQAEAVVVVVSFLQQHPEERHRYHLNSYPPWPDLNHRQPPQQDEEVVVVDWSLVAVDSSLSFGVDEIDLVVVVAGLLLRNYFHRDRMVASSFGQVVVAVVQIDWVEEAVVVVDQIVASFVEEDVEIRRPDDADADLVVEASPRHAAVAVAAAC